MLDRWDSFYVIVGSAAGALIGLQFVVMTLIAERPPPRAAEGSAAFSTPTIVHFSAALLLAALLRAPWGDALLPFSACSATGLCGGAYTLLTTWRMRVQTVYAPDLEDWIFHIAMPLAAYAVLGLSAFAPHTDADVMLFGIAGATLLLLFGSIHNAWDAVSYHVAVRAATHERQE